MDAGCQPDPESSHMEFDRADGDECDRAKLQVALTGLWPIGTNLVTQSGLSIADITNNLVASAVRAPMPGVTQ